jgi:DNA replication protein DnaC
MGYRVAYYRTSKLFTRLHGARADNSLYKEILRIEKQDLLILDDFELQNLDKSQRDLLMEIIKDRHNKNLQSLHLSYW